VPEFLVAPFRAIGEMVEHGGPFVFWIFMNGVVLWTLVIERIWYFSRVLPKDSKAMLAAWKARPDKQSWVSRQIRRAMLSKLNGGMSNTLPLLRAMVPLAPLLGLIGTVSGMLEVFDSMALRGSADARTMASGVSEAMICTLSGLAVSITGLYPAFYFTSRAQRETELLSDHFSYE
jgi:biopolymer transport protein ExbB